MAPRSADASVAPCRIAVVGAGLVGVNHCHAIKALEHAGAQLACLCQRSPDTTGPAERFGVPLYSDAEEMAKSQPLEGVVVSTPTHLHLPIVEKLIAGARARQAALGEEGLGLRSVLVEKPICEDLDAAMRLVELCESAGVVVLVGHQRRHSPLVQRARELLQDANFGPLRGVTAEFALLKPESYYRHDVPQLAWRTQKGAGGPALTNLIHDLDLLRYISGHEVMNVFAATSSAARDFEVEDTGAVTVVLDHGAVGTCFFSDSAPSPWSYEFTTRENKKYPPVPGSGQEDCYHFMGAHRSLAFPSMRVFSYGREVTEAGWDAPLTLEQHRPQTEDPLVNQMAHFLDVCRGEAEPVCSGRDGIQSLAAVMAVFRSAETQSSVRPADLMRRTSGGPWAQASGDLKDAPSPSTSFCETEASSEGL